MLGKQEADVAPLIVDKPDVVEVHEGEVIQITVSLKGHPEPAVSWQRDGDVLVSGDHYQVSYAFEQKKFLLSFLR